MRKLKEFCVGVEKYSKCNFYETIFFTAFLFYLDFKPFSRACVDKLYTTAGILYFLIQPSCLQYYRATNVLLFIAALITKALY